MLFVPSPRGVRLRGLSLCALALILGLGCASGRPLRVQGSESELELISGLAERFAAAHPGVGVALSGGGSAAGVTSLIDGAVDVATVSRPLLPTERVEAARRGVRLEATPFALDTICVVVNPQNPVAALDLDQLGEIFRGETTRWEALGGEGPISLYGRPSSSGTWSLLRERIVQGDYTPSIRALGGSAAVVQAVAADAHGLGYAALSYVRHAGDSVRVLGLVVRPGEAPVDPRDEAAAREGRYPLTRALSLVTLAEPRPEVAALVAFSRSDAGLAMIERAGLFALEADDAQR
ncbi:PstS family phosphate ABC transporter substrate-binding protein [Myxococcota bacterium]|nr:PstS family phosphate ABC transporter substrate-binding protein [Myxococcota bacterium]